MESKLGLTLVGEDMEEGPGGLADGRPGTLIPIDQDLFHELDAPFERGERAGWLHGTAVLTRRDRLVCHLTFLMIGDTEDCIVAEGVLPRDGDGIGAGLLAVTGGTGKFADAGGAVRVETRNPKRYSF